MTILFLYLCQLNMRILPSAEKYTEWITKWDAKKAAWKLQWDEKLPYRKIAAKGIALTVVGALCLASFILVLTLSFTTGPLIRWNGRTWTEDDFPKKQVEQSNFPYMTIADEDKDLTGIQFAKKHRPESYITFVLMWILSGVLAGFGGVMLGMGIYRLVNIKKLVNKQLEKQAQNAVNLATGSPADANSPADNPGADQSMAEPLLELQTS